MSQSYKILIAEDDHNLGWIYRSLLEEAGYEIHESDNGIEALALVHQVFPDLVLSDIVLPGMDGFELAEAIKGNPATRDIPIIFISGVVDDADRARSANLGICQHLSKPVQVMELLTAVRVKLKSA